MSEMVTFRRLGATTELERPLECIMVDDPRRKS